MKVNVLSPPLTRSRFGFGGLSTTMQQQQPPPQQQIGGLKTYHNMYQSPPRVAPSPRRYPNNYPSKSSPVTGKKFSTRVLQNPGGNSTLKLG